jgi:hypothetical protein
MENQLLTPERTIARLPTAVAALAQRLGADPSSTSSLVNLAQAGRMKTSLEAKSWTRFTASQSISTRGCAFDWRARMGPFGAVSVQDALEHGEGRLCVRALGAIPIGRPEPTPALTRGELMRYLAELAWAPDAILLNETLRWREISASTLAVSAEIGDTTAEVFFNLDSDGRIAGGFAPDRPRSPTAPFLPTLWSWRYSDYRQHAGRWIPFAGEVAWTIEDKEIIYWQGRLTEWRA